MWVCLSSRSHAVSQATRRTKQLKRNNHDMMLMQSWRARWADEWQTEDLSAFAKLGDAELISDVRPGCGCVDYSRESRTTPRWDSQTHSFAHPTNDANFVFATELEPLGILCDLAKDGKPFARLCLWIEKDGRQGFDSAREVDEGSCESGRVERVSSVGWMGSGQGRHVKGAF